MRSITVRDYIQGKANGRKIYIKTFHGVEEVTGIRWPETNPWVVCGKSNAGFGFSYCVHYDTPLYVEDGV